VRFFFDGTLIEPEILHAVLRRAVHPARRRNAVLRGYRRVYRKGASYPVLIADAASDVEGIVVSALTTPDVALLTAYEGPEYEIRELSVRLSGDGFVRAKVFLPRAACEASRVPWTTLEGWQRRYRRTFVRRLLPHRRTASAE
jgi:Gamma-glutamyl cyclotransferase, AIG2-like